MAMRIRSQSAMNGNRQLKINSENQRKTVEKLSSGFRINRAADDASGLAISEKMRRQIGGLTQGVRNVQAAIPDFLLRSDQKKYLAPSAEDFVPIR